MARFTAALSRLGPLLSGMQASGGVGASATSNAGGIPFLLSTRHFSEAAPPERTSFGNLQDKVRLRDVYLRAPRDAG